jgi:hypothetical protein
VRLWFKRDPTEDPIVPQIEVSEQQILDALDRLSLKARREAVRRLVAGASKLESMVESVQPRIAELARQRGLNWAELSDEEREDLVDDILHE